MRITSLPLCFVPVFLFVLLSAGCSRESYEQDADIDTDIAAKLAGLNGQLIRNMMSGNTKAIMAIAGDELKQNPNFEAGLRDLVESAKNAGSTPYHDVRRYYVHYPEKGREVIIKTGEQGEHDYTLSYRAPTRRSFITVGYFEDSLQTISLLTIWGSYNGEWKLNAAWAGLVKAYGKDAIDWYYRARQLYGDRALVDAANCMNICAALISPGGSCWHYRLEEDMRGLMEQIKNTAERDFSFPIRVETVAGAPRVFSATLKILREGYFPVINYATNLSLSDTVALSRECDSLNAHIGEVFNDIDHNNRRLFYCAYSNVPIDTFDKVPFRVFVKNSAAGWHY